MLSNETAAGDHPLAAVATMARIIESAESGQELTSVFENLPTNIIVKHDVEEVSVAFTALGALLAALSIGLSMLWRPLP